MRVKPRIVAFISSYFPYVGGAETSLRQVARLLSDEFDFLIITSRGQHDLPRFEILDQASVWRLGPGTPLDKWLLPPAAMFNWSRISSVGGEPRPLLLWGIDISQGALAAAVLHLRRRHIPMVFTIQYGGGAERLAHGRFGLIRQSFKYLLAQSDYVTAISSPLLELARAYGYQGPTTLIPNGVDLNLFQPVPRSHPQAHTTRVITVSRLDRKNGIDILLRAASLLTERVPDLECRIVGSGPERSKLENLAADLHLLKRVSFLGTLSQLEVARQLVECDIFVRPSRSEGMGNAFLEAMAMGLPVIGTPVGGLVDVIHDGRTGLMSVVDQPEDLANKIHRLLVDREFARTLAQEGLRHARENYNAAVCAQQYSQLFWKLLES